MFSTSLQTETFDHGNLILIRSRHASSTFNFVDEAGRSSRIRGHLTKRKESYSKEIWGPQEGVGLEYASTGQKQDNAGKRVLLYTEDSPRAYCSPSRVKDRMRLRRLPPLRDNSLSSRPGDRLVMTDLPIKYRPALDVSADSVLSPQIV